jgi:hypothetical protein
VTVTATNAMGGPIRLFTGLVGVTEPVNAGTAPGVGWTEAGGTEGGATLTLQQGLTTYKYDQVTMDVGADYQTEGAVVETNIAEPTLANLRLALNQAASAATDLEWGGRDLTNSSPLFSAVLLLGKKPGGGPRLWIVRRTLSTKDVGVPFKRDGQTVFPVAWTAFYVSSSITAVRVDDTPGP